MLISTNRIAVTFLSVAALMLASGCGEEPGVERRVVAGSVSYEGLPIETGEIRFVPLTEGPVSAGLISGGRYEVTHRGGVLLGESKVELIATGASEPMTQEQLDAMGSAPKTLAIPAKYNAQSELRATVQSGKGQQTIDFDLKR